ncbi:MAG: VOC family protein [Ilumatobacteraceae bacterium]
MNQHHDVAVPPSALTGLHHVRLTVTDIDRSKAFYSHLLGIEPAIDYTAEPIESGVRSDPHRFFGGCTFAFNDNLLGLRPVAEPGDRFDSTRVGLDHLSLGVNSMDDLRHAAECLDALGVENGGVVELPALGIAVLSFQDPDDINLELVTTIG